MAQPARTVPEPGVTIGGKYQLVRLIGEGGMGVVYEAKHLRLAQRIAIKFLHPKLVDDAAAVGRFEREARNASGLESLYAARIYDVDQTADGVPYMVSEYLEGVELVSEIKERSQLPIQEAVDYVIQAALAIADAHALGIVHRDLKPSNLFLTKTGKTRICKVLDFGISKGTSNKELELTTTGVLLGSPRYMSPEQVDGSKDIDGRTDIWSLGVILFHALSGGFPFEGANLTAVALAIATKPPRSLSALRPDVPKELEAAIMKALEKSVSQRYANVKDLVRALVPFASPRFASTLLGAGGHLSSPPPSPGVAGLAPAMGPAPKLWSPELEHGARRAPPDDPTMDLGGDVSASRSVRRDDQKRRRVAIAIGAVVLVGAAALGARALMSEAPPASSSASASASAPAIRITPATATTTAQPSAPASADVAPSSTVAASTATARPSATARPTGSASTKPPPANAPTAPTAPTATTATTAPTPPAPPKPARDPAYL